MNRLLSFEGIPQKKDGSTAQMRMRLELNEAVDSFAETLVWPDELVSLKARHKFFVVALQVDDKEVLQKLSSAIGKQMESYPVADNSDIIGDLKRAEHIYEEQKALFEEGGKSSDGSVARFESQDSTIDRAFQFLMKLVEAHPEVPSMRMWNQSMTVIKGVGSRMLKQKLVMEKLKKTRLPMFKNLNLNLPGDSLRLCKYQHPLLISVKRWCKGAACFTGISSMGQLLNKMHDKHSAMTQLLTLDDHLRQEMIYFMRNAGFTDDETLVYRRTRITYWLFHQLIKRTSNCLTWTGESSVTL